MYAETEVIQVICLQCQAPDLYHDMTAQLPNAGHPVAPQARVPMQGPVVLVPYGPNSQWPAAACQSSSYILTIPPAFMPNDYLPVTLVVVIILNSTSMAISLPAECSILVICCR